MPATNLPPKAEHEITPRQPKGSSIITSASLNLSTSFQNIVTWTDSASVAVDSTGWISCGNAPCVGASVLWTFSAGTILTVLPWVSNDPSFTIVHPGYVIRDAGATATDGYVTSYPAAIKLPKGAISSASGFYTGSGTTLYAPLVISTEGYRYFKLQALSDNASGSVIAYAAVGTNL